MPSDSHRSSHKKSKHHEETKRQLSIKPEPPDDSPHHKSLKMERRDMPRKRRKSTHSVHSSPASSSHERRHRLRVPQVLKQEEKEKKRRLRSPVLLDDNRNDEFSRRNSSSRERIGTSKADFSRSGLLTKSEAASGPKQRANFGLSGKLAEDTNTYKGVVIKYNEPDDARKPTEHWRLYVFKGNQTLPILHIHRQSGFLIGRDRKIADIPMDHPSISKQHAVLQYRLVRGLIRLYLIDLESANGTYLNNQRIEPRRYYELIEKDMIKFGYSSREYVVMTAELDEDDDEESSLNVNDALG